MVVFFFAQMNAACCIGGQKKIDLFSVSGILHAVGGG